jgi:hypothetical protein
MADRAELNVKGAFEALEKAGALRHVNKPGWTKEQGDYVYQLEMAVRGLVHAMQEIMRERSTLLHVLAGK